MVDLPVLTFRMNLSLTIFRYILWLRYIYLHCMVSVEHCRGLLNDLIRMTLR